jgi:hypothetical protein
MNSAYFVPQMPNNAINMDSHEQCSFGASLMAAGYGKR